MCEWEAERQVAVFKKKITKFTAVKCAHASPQVETHKQIETHKQVSHIS